MLKGPRFVPENPKKLLVTLHGYGANGDDLFDIGVMLIAGRSDIALYSPHAVEPFELAAVGGGYQWFGLPDLAQMTLQKGVHKALPNLLLYLDEITRYHNIRYEDVILFGFSQGCMMSLACLYFRPLGGVIGASGMLIKPENPEILKPKTKVLLTHGMMDTVVPYASAPIAKTFLEQDGMSVDLISRPTLAHAIDEVVITESIQFLNTVL
ncbi:MAG: hypothetical protein KBD31_04015 [Proteobacteria bacterium]|nr:hypothetical protein [Pseudomonadota bacterium]